MNAYDEPFDILLIDVFLLTTARTSVFATLSPLLAARLALAAASLFLAVGTTFRHVDLLRVSASRLTTLAGLRTTELASRPTCFATA